VHLLIYAIIELLWYKGENVEMNIDYSREFQAIVDVYKKVGGDANTLIDSHFGSLVINGDKVLGKNEIEGLHIRHRSIKNGVSVKIFVDEGTKIEFPVHLCFGMLPKEGIQVIRSEFFISDDAEVNFLSHCMFPNAVHIEHIMDAKVHIGENAHMSYVEEHFHSRSGGTWVYPTLVGEIGKNGRLFEEFKLVRGRVGTLKIDYEIEQGERSVCELLTKVYAKEDDKVEMREALFLNGEYAAGTTKTRVVLSDRSYGEVLGEVAGNAPYTRGHVDCQEIIQGDESVAVSIPKISVRNPLAKVTHEAAIGRIDKKELETLMSRGLTKDEAVDVVVKGLLR